MNGRPIVWFHYDNKRGYIVEDGGGNELVSGFYSGERVSKWANENGYELRKIEEKETQTKEG